MFYVLYHNKKREKQYMESDMNSFLKIILPLESRFLTHKNLRI